MTTDDECHPLQFLLVVSADCGTAHWLYVNYQLISLLEQISEYEYLYCNNFCIIEHNHIQMNHYIKLPSSILCLENKHTCTVTLSIRAVICNVQHSLLM